MPGEFVFVQDIGLSFTGLRPGECIIFQDIRTVVSGQSGLLAGLVASIFQDNQDSCLVDGNHQDWEGRASLSTQPKDLDV